MLKIKYLPSDSGKVLFLLPFNRSISPKHVNAMANSILLSDVLRPIVVARVAFLEGVRRSYIIDGQHLYFALIKLGMDFPIAYVYPKDLNEMISLMARLNTTSKSWLLGDYVNVWAAMTKENDYLKLKQYHQHYGYSYTSLCIALNARNPNHANERLKAGKFKIRDEKLGLEILSNLDGVFEVMPRGAQSEIRVMVESYVTFYIEHRKEYNHNKLMDSLRTNQMLLTANLHSVGECKTIISAAYHGTARENTHVAIVGKAGSVKRKITLTNKNKEGKTSTRTVRMSPK